MRSSTSTTSSPADRRRATNKVSASFMRQCYMKEGEAETPPTHPLCAPTPNPRVVRFALARTTDRRRSEPVQGRPGPNPSALMRSPHDLHGVFDMAPLPGFLGVALALARHGILGRRGGRLEAVLLDHLPGDRVNLHLGYHVALLMFRHSEPPGPVPVGRWTPFKRLNGGSRSARPRTQFCASIGTLQTVTPRAPRGARGSLPF